MRPGVLLLAVLGLLALAPGAVAQAPPPAMGTWVGSVRPPGAPVNRVRYDIRRLEAGRVAGTSRYRVSGSVCRYRLVLRARERGGFRFRERYVSGRNCTRGDRVFVRADGDRLRVRIRSPQARATVRFSLRRA